MFKKKSSVVLIYMVGVTMVGVMTFASIPGNLSPVPAVVSASPSATGKKLQIAQAAPVMFDTIPLDNGKAPVAETSRALTPHLQTIAYGPTSGAVTGAVVPLATVTPISAVSGGTPLVGDLAEVDCRVDPYGHKVALPLEKLVEVLSSAINTAGPNSTIDSIRMTVQAGLNRSGDFPNVKTEALHRLQAVYRANSAPALALSKPFDLSDNGMVYANGYDPCGNPAATAGGAAFGTGPFSNVFTTINPIPVVAARSTATTEGGPAV